MKRKQDDADQSASESAKPKPTASKGKAKALTAKKPKIDESEGEPAVQVLKNAEGEKYIDLGKKRRVTVRPFKGQPYVDIREFYGADGDEKPGKKGISLTLEQWEALKRSSSTIDSLFAEQSGKK